MKKDIPRRTEKREIPGDVPDHFSCRLCKSNRLRRFYPRAPYWFICKDCSLVQKHPLEVQYQRQFVENDVYEWGVASRSWKESSFAQEVESSSQSLAMIESHTSLTPDSLILDFGSGTGAFLKRLQTAGIRGIGVELSIKNTEFALSHGLTVVPSLNSPNLGMGTFDAIHLQNSGTYIPELGETFCRFHDLLKGSGILVWHDKDYHFSRYNVPAHFVEFGPAVYFSRTSVENIFLFSGFKLIQYYNHGGTFSLIARKESEVPKKAFKGYFLLEILILRLLPTTDRISKFAYGLLNIISGIKRKIKGD